MAEKQAKPAVDWERIEVEYRAGIKSVREIAAAHGVSHVAIGKRAKKDQWARDLKAKIQAKAEELVTKATVTKVVTKVVTAEALETERQTVEVNAQALATVRLEHRTDIKRGRSLVNKLLTELEGVTDHPDLIEDLQQALFQAESGGEDGDEVDRQAARGRAQRLRDALERVVGRQGRVSSVKGLAESMRILITLEREAWGLSDAGAGGSGFERMLTEIHGAVS